MVFADAGQEPIELAGDFGGCVVDGFADVVGLDGCSEVMFFAKDDDIGAEAIFFGAQNCLDGGEFEGFSVESRSDSVGNAGADFVGHGEVTSTDAEIHNSLLWLH